MPDGLFCDILQMFFADRTPTAINPRDVHGNWNLNAIDITWANLPRQYWHEWTNAFEQAVPPIAMNKINAKWKQEADQTWENYQNFWTNKLPAAFCDHGEKE